ncbi:hypothetical protein [Marivita sp. GX14005]|uniref:hypothetical protein n=1 Tax=Marivita sp. GX14005 TaxID=2942276 RepID=UPI002018CB75|nr:hypothetical protein [Marivita sp. GX14005]MCL3881202.1 hypothetical protein [Marivita sp. GX14005]
MRLIIKTSLFFQWLRNVSDAVPLAGRMKSQPLRVNACEKNLFSGGFRAVGNGRAGAHSIDKPAACIDMMAR